MQIQIVNKNKLDLSVNNRPSDNLFPCIMLQITPAHSGSRVDADVNRSTVQIVNNDKQDLSVTLSKNKELDCSHLRLSGCHLTKKMNVCKIFDPDSHEFGRFTSNQVGLLALHEVKLG